MLQGFYKSSFEEKTTKLSDTVSKIGKNEKKKKSATFPVYDVNKETIKFLRNIDYARLRNFDLKTLLKSEISPMSFYLMHEGYIRKPKKSDLATELKNLLPDALPTSLPPADNNRALILDFMGYARKVPVKKQHLKTYRDFFVSLWNTFKSLGNTCQRIDIVFDLYKEQSIKASERNRRATVAGIETYITNVDQSLPIEMDRFWSVGKNKVAFQRLFIKWMMQDQSRNESNKTIFLGGSHREGDHLCFSVTDGNVSLEHLLECSHEEADDRVLFHASHAVKCGHFKSVAIASPDVDIFVNSTHHYI